MTKFPLLNQVFHLRPNRTYQFILKDDKLYGIYLGGFFQLLTRTAVLVWVFAVLFSLGLSVALYFLLPDFIRNIYDTFLDIILFMTFYSFLYWNITEFVQFVKDKINVEKHHKWQKLDQVVNQQLELIEGRDDDQFKKINKRNIIIDLNELKEIRTLPVSIIWKSFQEHYGQINFTLKSGGKMQFLLLKDEEINLLNMENILSEKIGKTSSKNLYKI